jgi:senataxin
VVCAPTNKAVSVLAKRFLAAATDENGCSVRMLLVGDDEKLLESNKKSALRPHYVYSWRKEVSKELKIMTKFYHANNQDVHEYSQKDMLKKANNLRREIFRRLISLPPVIKNKFDELCKGLADPKCGKESLFILATQASNAIGGLKGDAIEFDLMKSADVVFCTLCSSASRVMRLTGESIEALIVDEAAASTEPDLYIPFHLRPSKLLVVGDPNQLPSTVLSDRAKGLGLDVSLQERLMMHCGYEFTMLDVQYRMHPEISSFPSRQFYNSQLRDGENVMVERGRRALLLNGRPYSFLQVNGTETKGSTHSTCNAMEANAVVDLVKELVHESEQYRSSVQMLRIITFYTAQVFLIRKMLDNAGFNYVLVAAVDSSQGCEADVVIVSLVRSVSAGFLKDDSRMNVALTRARYQLVCVGNVARYSSMEAVHTLHHLAVDARDRNAIVEKEVCIDRPVKRIKNEWSC